MTIPIGTGWSRTTPSMAPMTPPWSTPLGGVSAQMRRQERKTGTMTNHKNQ